MVIADEKVTVATVANAPIKILLDAGRVCGDTIEMVALPARDDHIIRH